MIPLINYRLMRLVETGIIQHKQDEDLPLAEICPVDRSSFDRKTTPKHRPSFNVQSHYSRLCYCYDYLSVRSHFCVHVGLGKEQKKRHAQIGKETAKSSS